MDTITMPHVNMIPAELNLLSKEDFNRLLEKYHGTNPQTGYPIRKLQYFLYKYCKLRYYPNWETKKSFTLGEILVLYLNGRDVFSSINVMLCRITKLVMSDLLNKHIIELEYFFEMLHYLEFVKEEHKQPLYLSKLIEKIVDKLNDNNFLFLTIKDKKVSTNITKRRYIKPGKFVRTIFTINDGVLYTGNARKYACVPANICKDMISREFDSLLFLMMSATLVEFGNRAVKLDLHHPVIQDGVNDFSYYLRTFPVFAQALNIHKEKDKNDIPK